jgi:hypothetical protein
MYIPNLNLLADLWGKKSEERIQLSRQKNQPYFVKAIDVAQNIKQYGFFYFIYCF